MKETIGGDTTSIETEAVSNKEEKTMKQIINVFSENDWTYEESIHFLPEIEKLLKLICFKQRILKKD
ncbi:hypothetical protein IIC_02381 [Bacillus cereus VD021]|uniref:Uncharacterized protein n=1 Tax=Bacillus cereus VD021 TaxID=1053224 RepID=R8HQB3_BACCE|nr:hypothetical protein [Bacillus cereus]EOO74927.1 hypothetical protein IIC_02381 [Bacillus cereus VD021]